MAVLNNASRRQIFKAFMEEISASNEAVGPFEKTDLQAAFNALDDFFNNNAAAINQAIPQPARSVLTTPQKARMAVHVIQRRFLDGA